MDCASSDEGPAPETYGDLSAWVQKLIDEASALVPPAEVAEWHNAGRTTLEELKAFFDPFPKDDEIDVLALSALFASF